EDRPLAAGELRTRPAVLGVRAEDVCVVRGDAAGQPAVSPSATVRSIELTGDASLATLAVETHQNAVCNVVTRLGPRETLAVGERVKIVVDAGRVHLFDPR